MTKERISSDVDRKLRIELDTKANELGISRAKLIEIALKSELGHFNVHKENKRLTESEGAVRRAGFRTHRHVRRLGITEESTYRTTQRSNQ